MKTPIGVLYAPGTNCHEETIDALDSVGGSAKLAIFKALLSGSDKLTNYSALVLPGGFSWGDHIGAGRIAAIVLVSCLRDQLQNVIGRIPILGICNGFQILVETGLLPDGKIGEREIALVQNTSSVFESRWVYLLFNNNQCIFTEGLDGMVLRMPVAHREGRLNNPNNIPIKPVCYYVDRQGQPTMDYPQNPNGSVDAIAGICDKTGLIFGLMPHPERAVSDILGSTDGLAIFRNLVRYINS